MVSSCCGQFSIAVQSNPSLALSCCSEAEMICLSATMNSFSFCKDDGHQQFTFFYSITVSSFTVYYFHSVVSPVCAAADRCCWESITAHFIMDLK